MKFLVGFATVSLALVALAEPPVGNYLPPGQGFSSPSQNYGAPHKPSPQYGAPSRPSSSYGAPSQSYGAPSQSYGAPSHGGYDSHAEEYNEPARYDFEYMVKDDHYGTDFGHKESRDDEMTHGEYFVLLPDGRKQTVKYEADSKGYRPVITYEDVGAGYGRGPANGGYPSGPANGGYSSGQHGY